MRWLFDETEALRRKSEEFERIRREWVEANHPLRNLYVLDNDYLNEVNDNWNNIRKRVLHDTVKLEDAYQSFITSVSGADLDACILRDVVATMYGDTCDDVVIVESAEDLKPMKYDDLMGFDSR